MAVEHRPLKLAVLIDADNMSADIADGLFQEIAKIGEASVRRIYGDSANGNAKNWAELIPHHAMLFQRQAPGKNASDIALVIDAMDLLHGGRFDGFCLVSSDKDFSRLAIRIREQGLAVYGFGEAKTAESFQRACVTFFEIGTPPKKDTGARQPPKSPQAVPKAKPRAKTTPEKSLEQKADLLLPTLRKGFDITVGANGWASLDQLGKAIKQFAPSFTWKGYGSLGALMQKTGAFIVDGTGPARRARLMAPTVQIAEAAHETPNQLPQPPASPPPPAVLISR